MKNSTRFHTTPGDSQKRRLKPSPTVAIAITLVCIAVPLATLGEEAPDEATKSKLAPRIELEEPETFWKKPSKYRDLFEDDPVYNPNHLNCGQSKTMFTNQGAVSRTMAVWMPEACPGSYLIISDPHHDCLGEQRIDLLGPRDGSIPLTTFTVCPGGEVTVFCGEGGEDDEGCDVRLRYYTRIVAHEREEVGSPVRGRSHSEPAILARLLAQIDELTRRVNVTKPFVMDVDCSEGGALIFANGPWAGDAAQAQSPVSISVEIAGDRRGVEFIADAAGTTDPLIVSDGDDGLEDGSISRHSFSVTGGGYVYLHYPGLNDEDATPNCTAKVWIHGANGE